MSARVSEVSNPFFMEDDSVAKDVRFHSARFRITENNLDGDNERYEALMQSMYPFDPDSNLVVNPYVSNAISKTWTKDGDLLIHVEYIEMVEDEVKAVQARVGGTVDGFQRTKDGGFVITIAGVDHSVPAGFDIKVRAGDDVSAGDVIGGTATPQADERDY